MPAIEVAVTVEYLREQSNPDNSEYVFAYTVTMTNNSHTPAQLISRHWVIRDEHQTMTEVKGLGVVGKQPLLAPGEQFSYSSGTMIKTATGEMKGTYHFVTEDADYFDVDIPLFLLVSERTLH